MFGLGEVFGRKPRQFTYRPRYYDPEKEAKNKRRIELGLEPVMDDDKNAERKPGDLLRFRRSLTQERFAEDRNTRKGTSVKLTVIIFVLIGLFVWLISGLS